MNGKKLSVESNTKRQDGPRIGAPLYPVEVKKMAAKKKAKKGKKGKQ